MKPKHFVLDVDGVMTTGQFWYSEDGKELKCFGPHDNDGIKLLKGKISIHFITADKRGFPISKKRIVDDMQQELNLVPEAERYAYFERLGIKETIYMGDGIHDAPVLKDCLFGIAPANARKEAKETADFITESKAGEGAVLDACQEIKKRYFS